MKSSFARVYFTWNIHWGG